MVAKLTARLAQLQATAVPPVGPEGCLPVVVDGAWRPCDVPSPFGPGGSAGQPIELVARVSNRVEALASSEATV